MWQLPIDRNVGIACNAHDVGESIKRLGAGAVHILQIVALRGRHENDHGIDAGLGCAVGTARIGHKSGQHRAFRAVDAGQNLCRIPHLRHGAWRNEGRDLQMADTGIDQPVDEGDFPVRRHELRLRLQSVARPYFDDADAFGEPFHKVAGWCCHDFSSHLIASVDRIGIPSSKERSMPVPKMADRKAGRLVRTAAHAGGVPVRHG